MTTTHLDLTIEKPAAGGRMIARHDGQVVLVSGAIPGERVTASVQHRKGGVVYAAVAHVLSPSADRREPAGDPACGGTVYAHVAYGRQCALKSEIVADAFRRIAKLPLEAPVPVHPSPETGYRMRARLHVRGTRIGFFREGTHDLCDPAATHQLLPGTAAAIEALSGELRASGVNDVREIDLSENVPASERAVLIELAPGSGAIPTAVLGLLRGGELTGVVVSRPDAPDRTASRGRADVSDVLRLEVGGSTAALTIRRQVASFFQGNRYLLVPLVESVVRRVPAGPVIDLYAGVGLFGLACAAAGLGPIVAVEGDRRGAQDLADNARPFGSAVRTVSASVEAFLARERVPAEATVLLDPPRTGLSKAAIEAVCRAEARRVVYVSCDTATLARDVRRMVESGYRLAHLEAFDLFPNTAHVESLAVLERGSG
jgi:23S rRNA (uracil1939-C5)-methyltransferase